MKTYVHKGIYSKGTVYVLESINDWDEYEKLLKDKYEILTLSPNFYAFKEDFIKYIGRNWKDITGSYKCSKNATYKLIALEDDDPNADWYWVAENIDDSRDTVYLLANSKDIENGLVD